MLKTPRSLGRGVFSIGRSARLGFPRWQPGLQFQNRLRHRCSLRVQGGTRPLEIVSLTARVRSHDPPNLDGF